MKILQKWYPISNGMFIYQNELCNIVGYAEYMTYYLIRIEYRFSIGVTQHNVQPFKLQPSLNKIRSEKIKNILRKNWFIYIYFNCSLYHVKYLNVLLRFAFRIEDVVIKTKIKIWII